METVLLDANAIIDLLALSCLEAAARIPVLRIGMVENVRREITREDQRAELDRLLVSGLIEETRVGEREDGGLEELATYARLKSVLGDGEAASLAVAHHRGWIFVSYKKGRLRREAQALLGKRFWTTPSFLASLVQAQVTTFTHLESAAAMCALAEADSACRKAAHLSRLVAEARSLISSRLEGDPA